MGLGAGIGLQAVAKTPTQTDEQLAINAECVSRMEQMRATAFASLGAKATALSGNVAINGKTYACTVKASAADADGDGNNETDFDVITVSIGPRTLTCYVVQP